MKKSFAVLLMLPFLFISMVANSQQHVKTVAALRYGENPVSGRYIQTRGFRMYVEIYGQGKPLLLIHVNGGSIASMANQIPFFSKSYKVIAADSRSQGKSVDQQDSLSYEMMADDFNALMDSLHVDSASVVGWSDGGIIGLLLAIRHPGKVKKLAVTGANIRPDTTAVTGADILGMIQQVNQLSKQTQDPIIKNQVKLTRMMIDQPNISHEALRLIRCSTLVIGGDHDIIKPAHTLEIYQSIPGACLWILPGSGHGTLIEHKEDFNQQVGIFFNQ